MSGDFFVIVWLLNGLKIINIIPDEGYYRMNYGFNVTERKGKRYLSLGNESFKFDAEKMTFKFENLFNGDEILGKIPPDS